MTDPEFPHGERSRSAPLLVGRAREHELLRAHLTAALACHGSFVLIGGEAGIGKTALAEALLGRGDQGALVLVGRCYDLSETPPYGPWTDLLDRAPAAGLPPVPPDRGGRPGGSQSQAVLFARVRDFLLAVAAGDRSCSFSRICTGPTRPVSTCCASWPASWQELRSFYWPPIARKS